MSIVGLCIMWVDLIINKDIKKKKIIMDILSILYSHVILYADFNRFILGISTD